jgi:DNA-binding MarR family transcriptional regulator
MTPQSVMHVELLIRPTQEELLAMKKKAPKRAALIEILLNHSGPLTEVYLEKVLKTGSVSDQLDALENAGIIITKRNLELSAKPRLRKMVRVSDTCMQDDARLKSILNELDATSPKQAAILSHVYLHQTLHGSGLPLQDVKEKLKLASTSGHA